MEGIKVMNGTTGKGESIGEEVKYNMETGRALIFARNGSCKVKHDIASDAYSAEDLGDSVPGNGNDTYITVNLYADAELTIEALEADTHVHVIEQATFNMNPRS